MPNNRSAAKRLKTSEKSRVRHKARRASLKTAEKVLRELSEKGKKEAIQDQFRLCCSKLDKSVKNGSLHRNKARRKKKQFSKLLAAAD